MTNSPEFPQPPLDLAHEQFLDVTIIDPEFTVSQPTPAEQLGLEDEKFQVFRNPAEGETAGHFETGWKVRDALNKREPDGTSHPVVVLEKKTVDGQGTEVIDEKTIDRETFLSWQPPIEMVATELPDESNEADDVFMQYEEQDLAEDLKIAEELGETVVEETAEIDELPVVDAESFEPKEPTEAVATTDPATPEEQKADTADFQAIFADGTSFQLALGDPSVSPETKQQLQAIATHWKNTLGAVQAIDRAWGEDLRPAVDAVLRELPENVSSLQRLHIQSEEIAGALQQLAHYRESGDAESAQRVFNQLNLDMAIPTLRTAAGKFNEPDVLLPSAKHLRTQHEVALERISHARYGTELAPADLQALVSYAQSHLTSGATLADIMSAMGDEAWPLLQSWNATEVLTQDTATMAAVLPVEDVASMFLQLSTSLKDLQAQPNLDHKSVGDISQRAQRLLAELEFAQSRFYRLQIMAEDTLASRPRT